MSTSVRPEEMSDADLWEHLVASGMPKAEATSAVQSRQRRPSVSVPRESVDLRGTAESTKGLPYDPDRQGDLGAATPAMLGLLSVAGQVLPGMETVQAGARSVARTGLSKLGAPVDAESFSEARDNIRGVTNTIPAPIKIAAQAPSMVAGAKALTSLPGAVGKAMRSPAVSGAAIGGADQLLSADDMTLEQRLAKTGGGVALGGLIGKVSDAAVTGTRAVAGKKFSERLNAREEAMGAADRVNYGAAESGMTASGGTSPAIQAALRDPKVAPLVKALRETEEFAGADDATVLRELYTQLSEKQRSLGRVLESAEDHRPSPRLQKTEIERTKKSLLGAADEMGPEFRTAVGEHAKREGEIRALKHGKEASRQAIGKLEPSSAKGQKSSAAALRKKASNMTLEERIAAEEGALAQLKRSVGLEGNLISGAGLLTSAIRPTRVAPLLRDLDTPTQRTLDDIIRAAMLGGSSLVP